MARTRLRSRKGFCGLPRSGLGAFSPRRPAERRAFCFFRAILAIQLPKRSRPVEDEENDFECRKGREHPLKIALRFTPQHFQDSIASSRGNEEYQKYYRKMQNGEEQRHR